jgi:hypothetical protein
LSAATPATLLTRSAGDYIVTFERQGVILSLSSSKKLRTWCAGRRGVPRARPQHFAGLVNSCYSSLISSDTRKMTTVRLLKKYKKEPPRSVVMVWCFRLCSTMVARGRGEVERFLLRVVKEEAECRRNSWAQSNELSRASPS